MTFRIVETNEYGHLYCIAVVESWIEDNTIKWPGKRKYMQCLKSSKNPEPDWETIPITRVLSSVITTWQEARKKERILQYQSEEEIVECDASNKKQKGSDYDANAFFDTTVSVADEDIGKNLNISHMTTTNDLPSMSYSTTPNMTLSSISSPISNPITAVSNYVPHISNDNTNIIKESENNENMCGTATEVITTETTTNENTIIFQNATPIFRQNAFIGEYPTTPATTSNTLEIPTDIIMPVPSNGSTKEQHYVLNIKEKCNKSCRRCCITENSEILKHIWGSLSLLSNGLQGLFTEVKDIRDQIQNTKEKNSFNLLPKMPLENLDSVAAFNDSLNNESRKQQMIEKLRQIGGKGVGSSVRSCMKFMFKDEVLVLFSWAGITNKKKFSDLKNILNCIYSAIFRNNENSTEADIKVHLQSWIKHAQERINNKLK